MHPVVTAATLHHLEKMALDEMIRRLTETFSGVHLVGDLYTLTMNSMLPVGLRCLW